MNISNWADWETIKLQARMSLEFTDSTDLEGSVGICACVMNLHSDVQVIKEEIAELSSSAFLNLILSWTLLNPCQDSGRELIPELFPEELQWLAREEVDSAFSRLEEYNQAVYPARYA